MKTKFFCLGKRLLTVLACVLVCGGLLVAPNSPAPVATAGSVIDPTVLPAATPAPLAEIRLTEVNDGQHVELFQGQTLTVDLESNPSTGYSWEVAKVDTSVLSQVGKTEFEQKSPLPGAPARQIFHFKAVGEGQSTLKLIYHRPWEKGVEPTKEFSAKVVVYLPTTLVMVTPTPALGKGLTAPMMEPMRMELPKQQPGVGSEPEETKLGESGGIELPGDMGAWSTIMTEDFEGVFPGTKWTRYWASNGYTWDDVSYRAHTGSWSGWCADDSMAGNPDLNPPGPYANNMNAWMVYGPFDLSDATDAELLFYHWTKTEANYDKFFVGASVNGSSFYGTRYSGDWVSSCGGWCYVNFDLTNVYILGDLCGYRNVWIAFAFTSDSSVTYEGTYLDDIILRKVTGRSPSPFPAAFDWRASGGVTDVKNQGGCGSCWAFGTVGPLEANVKIKDATTTDLSEQYLVSCNTDGWSCDGGWWAHDYHQWKRPPSESEAGAVYEANFPYQADDPPNVPCRGPYPHPYKLSSWACIGAGAAKPHCCTGSILSREAIKQAIMTYGPVSAVVCVGPAFGGYTGGVLVDDDGPCTNHGIVLVGWDDNQGTNGVWILRNSWGPGWGEGGYMRIGYDISNVGACANYVVYRLQRRNPSDFDGDGKSDMAVFRPSWGAWFVLRSDSNWTTSIAKGWGTNGDTPLAGDFDGDGKSDMAVFRPSWGAWFILLSGSNYTTSIAKGWGTNGDIPLAGDFDGDGKADMAIFRPSWGTWFVLLSGSNYTTYIAKGWGTGGDIPLAGDFDGDGKADMAVFRPSLGTWFVLLSGSNYTTYVAKGWGTNGDTPLAGDFDGDGKADMAVFRPSLGTWFVLLSGSNYTTYIAKVWGTNGDIPVGR